MVEGNSHLQTQPLCLSGRCVSSSSWRFLSMATKTTFPPAHRGPTWPRNWKNTPRPATTTVATTASMAATEREARQANPTTGEIPPRRDTMVRKILGWTHTTKMFWILNHQSHNNIMLLSFIIYLLPLCKSSSGVLVYGYFCFYFWLPGGTKCVTAGGSSAQMLRL